MKFIDDIKRKNRIRDIQSGKIKEFTEEDLCDAEMVLAILNRKDVGLLNVPSIIRNFTDDIAVMQRAVYLDPTNIEYATDMLITFGAEFNDGLQNIAVQGVKDRAEEEARYVFGKSHKEIQEARDLIPVKVHEAQNYVNEITVVRFEKERLAESKQ